MEKIKAMSRRILALLICLAAFFAAAPAGFGDEGEDSGEAIFDPQELEAIVTGYIEEKSLNPEKISVGYCYTATGDSWCYNGDKWYYSASMYKVPLMMIFAEQEYAGEISQETQFGGLTLAQAEEYILVNSNNDYAHMMMSYLGTDRQCRELYQQYSDLPVDQYDPDFYDYSYFTAEFMMDVMETLYFEQERFPHIIDCLKRAQPEEYFNVYLSNSYEIAQKYGSYKEFNSTTGIIYTPNPFILTVMTEDLSVAAGANASAELAQRFAQYTLELDRQLEEYEQALLAQQEQQEQERLEQEEEERRARQEEERKAQEEELARQQAEQAALEAAQREKTIKILVAAGLALVLAVSLLVGLIRRSRRKKIVYAGGGSSSATQRGKRESRRGYTPKH